MTRLPVVGFPCDRRLLGKHPFHLVGEKYITAIREGSGALPSSIRPWWSRSCFTISTAFCSPVRRPMSRQDTTADLRRERA